MSNSEKKLERLLRKVVHEFSFELDANYENEDIERLLYSDSTFATFSSAVRELRKRKMRVSRRVLHVERRIEAARSTLAGGEGAH
jgi:hypothetical protein